MISLCLTPDDVHETVFVISSGVIDVKMVESLEVRLADGVVAFDPTAAYKFLRDGVVAALDMTGTIVDDHRLVVCISEQSDLVAKLQRDLAAAKIEIKHLEDFATASRSETCALLNRALKAELAVASLRR